MKASPGIAAFNSGELSPACEGRTDLKQYATGCYKLENFIPMVQGPARRRPGTRFVGAVANSAHRTALMEFNKSVAVAYVLEWGDHYVRFYQNYEQVMILTAPFVWNLTLNGTTADNTVVWTNRGKPAWIANTVTTQYSYIIDPNGNIQCAVNLLGAATTGAAPPTWNTSVNALTFDNGQVIWQNFGQASWAGSHAYLGVYYVVIIDPNGNIEEATTGGTSSPAGTVVPYQIASPYAYTDLFDSNGFFMLVFVQSADVIYICHRSKTFPVYKLSHYAPTNWTLAPVNFLGGPFATPNPGNDPCIYASAQTGDGITLIASANVFDPDGNGDLIGAFINLVEDNIRNTRPWEPNVTVVAGQRRRNNGVAYECLVGAIISSPGVGGTGTVPPTQLSGQAWDGGGPGSGALWEYRDPGQGFAQIVSIGTPPTGAMVALTNITSATPPVVTVSAIPPGMVNGSIIFITGVAGCTEVNDAFYVVAGLSGLTFSLTQADIDGDGTSGNVKGATWDAYTDGGTVSNNLWTCIANVVDQSNIVGTVNRLPKAVVGYENCTPNWAYSAWNNRDGYPNACSFFEGRLAFARDGNVIISVASDFENFNYITPGGQITADMAINVTLPTQDEVDWLVEGQVLVVGTQGAEHIIQEIDSGQPLSPSNVAARNQMRHGSRRVRPALIGYALVWCQTSGQKLRIMKYQFYVNQYLSEDLAALANHIFESYGPTALAFQQEPDSVIWLVRADGMLVGFTFNEEQNVLAWHRHPMTAGAIVESIACIPNPNQNQDDLWMIVNRTINGVTQRYIEYMAPHFVTGNSLVTQALYSDCGVTITNGSPTTAITGLGYLAGMTVKVLTDGSLHPDCVVSLTGTITLNWAATVVQIGLEQLAELTTMPIEAGAQTGTAQGKIKRITDCNVRFLNTLGGQLGRYDPDAEIEEPPTAVFETLIFRDPSDNMGAPVPVYNGIFPRESYDQPFPGGYEVEGRITYRNNTPYPATVASIYPVLEVED